MRFLIPALVAIVAACTTTPSTPDQQLDRAALALDIVATEYAAELGNAGRSEEEIRDALMVFDTASDAIGAAATQYRERGTMADSTTVFAAARQAGLSYVAFIESQYGPDSVDAIVARRPSVTRLPAART